MILLVVIVVLVLLSQRSVVPPSDTVEPQPNNQTNNNTSDKDGLQLYRNEEWGFEFWYPENWRIEENSVRTVSSKFNLILTPMEGPYQPLSPILLNVVTPDFGNYTFQDLDKTVSDINIDGVAGERYDYKLKNVQRISILLPLDDLRIILGAGKGYEDTFDKIVSTFKFLSDIKTYRNKKYGFKLEYPKKYIIKENEIHWDSEEGVPEDRLEGYRYEKPVSPLFYLQFYSSSTRKYPEIEIAVYNSNDLNIDEWIDYINKGVKQGLIYEGRYISNAEPILVLGIKSVKALSGCCMECIINIFTPRENKIYDLKQGGSISSPQECPSRFNEQYRCCLQNEDVFNQILATFKFL